jgi:hypothetical protein
MPKPSNSRSQPRKSQSHNTAKRVVATRLDRPFSSNLRVPPIIAKQLDILDPGLQHFAWALICMYLNDKSLQKVPTKVADARAKRVLRVALNTIGKIQRHLVPLTALCADAGEQIIDSWSAPGKLPLLHRLIAPDRKLDRINKETRTRPIGNFIQEISAIQKYLDHQWKIISILLRFRKASWRRSGIRSIGEITLVLERLLRTRVSRYEAHRRIEEIYISVGMGESRHARPEKGYSPTLYMQVKRLSTNQKQSIGRVIQRT